MPRKFEKDVKDLTEAIRLNVQRGEDGEPVVKVRFIADELEVVNKRLKKVM